MACNCLTMTRGDTAKFKFVRLNLDGDPILEKADELYFTVKPSPDDLNPSFQVTIDEMTFDTETGEYDFVILPTYTNNMDFNKKHWYDLEVIDGGVKTTISYGQFKLKPEVTWAKNEGE